MNSPPAPVARRCASTRGGGHGGLVHAGAGASFHPPLMMRTTGGGGLAGNAQDGTGRDATAAGSPLPSSRRMAVACAGAARLARPRRVVQASSSGRRPTATRPRSAGDNRAAAGQAESRTRQAARSALLGVISRERRPAAASIVEREAPAPARASSARGPRRRRRHRGAPLANRASISSSASSTATDVWRPADRGESDFGSEPGPPCPRICGRIRRARRPSACRRRRGSACTVAAELLEAGPGGLVRALLRVELLEAPRREEPGPWRRST